MFNRLRMLILHLIWFLSLVFFISGCGDMFDFSTKTPDTPDTTKPSVSSTSPGSGAPVNSTISATFSEGVYFDSFTLTSESSVSRSGTSSGGNGSSTVSFSPSPSTILNYGTTYTAKITNVRDGAGNVLGNVSWSFTTTSSAPSTYHKTPDGTINDVGSYNSIVLGLDENMKPGIKTSYITYYNSTDRSLHIIATADGTNFVGPYKIAGPSGAATFGEYASSVIDGTGKFHVAYYDDGGGLMYNTTTNISSWPDPIVVDNSSAIVGKYTSIALDSNGKVHISYYDQTNTALKYATNASGGWVNYTVDPNLGGDNPGLYTSIKVKNGKVHISYYASATGDLKYIKSPNWVPFVLDSTGNVGEFSSLYVDDNGNGYVYYNHVSAADGKRRIRVITDVSGTWLHSDVTEISGGVTSNPIFVDSNGIWHLSYYSGGVLYYRSGLLFDPSSNTWDWSTAKAVDPSGIGNGIYTSIVADSDGKSRISYYDATEGDLKFAK